MLLFFLIRTIYLSQRTNRTWLCLENRHFLAQLQSNPCASQDLLPRLKEVFALAGVEECSHTASLCLSALKKKWLGHFFVNKGAVGFPLRGEEERGGTGSPPPLSPWPSRSQIERLVPAGQEAELSAVGAFRASLLGLRSRRQRSVAAAAVRLALQGLVQGKSRCEECSGLSWSVPVQNK